MTWQSRVATELARQGLGGVDNALGPRTTRLGPVHNKGVRVTKEFCRDKGTL